jgi:ATP-dependent RNA helicase DHX57
MALLLFGGKYELLYGGKAISIDSVRFKAFPRISALITGIRKLLELALTDKINDPAIDVLNSDMGKLCMDLLQFTV